ATVRRARNGKILAYQSVLRDITERKRAEQELRQYRDHLEELVEVRTAELKRANSLLEQEVMERRRVEVTLNRQNEYLAALHETTLGLISRLNLNELLEALV